MFNYTNQPPYTGRDLLAIDIIRGRDVGLQPYNKVKHLCGLPLAKDFDDLDQIHIKVYNSLLFYDYEARFFKPCEVIIA